LKQTYGYTGNRPPYSNLLWAYGHAMMRPVQNDDEAPHENVLNGRLIARVLMAHEEATKCRQISKQSDEDCYSEEPLYSHGPVTGSSNSAVGSHVESDESVKSAPF